MREQGRPGNCAIKSAIKINENHFQCLRQWIIWCDERNGQFAWTIGWILTGYFFALMTSTKSNGGLTEWTSLQTGCSFHHVQSCARVIISSWCWRCWFSWTESLQDKKLSVIFVTEFFVECWANHNPIVIFSGSGWRHRQTDRGMDSTESFTPLQWIIIKAIINFDGNPSQEWQDSSLKKKK